MSPLPAWLQTPPPTLGLQLDAQRVTAVLVDRDAAVAAGARRGVDGAAAGRRRAVADGAQRPAARRRRPGPARPRRPDRRPTAARRAGRPGHRGQGLAAAVRSDSGQRPRPRATGAAAVAQDGAVPGRGRAGHLVARRRSRTAARSWSSPRCAATSSRSTRRVCAAAGLHAGTIDLATFNVVNLALLGGPSGSRTARRHACWCTSRPAMHRSRCCATAR